MGKNDNGQIKNIEEIGNDQSKAVTGGRKGFFPKINIFNTYCDFCDNKIDGKICFGVPVLNDKRIMCNECYKKQSELLGPYAAAKKWLAIGDKKSNKPEKPINIEKN